MYFLVQHATPGPDRPSAVMVRMKTSAGAPHVAFGAREIGERYLAISELGMSFGLLEESELDDRVLYAFENGLLLFDSEDSLYAFLINREDFDYAARITAYEPAEPSRFAWNHSRERVIKPDGQAMRSPARRTLQ